MRALRVLVIVMGGLLVGGTVALIGVIVSRASYRAAAPPTVAAPTAVAFPGGGSILSVQPVGPHIVVQVGLPDGGAQRQQLLVIDPASGALRARIDLRAD